MPKIQDDILSYREMCDQEKAQALQRGMNLFKLLFLLITIFFSAFVHAETIPEILISGVRTAEDQFRFDPKPQESEYLRTFQGGFKISKYGARYWVLWDVIKDRDKPLYVRMELQNPLNKKRPIIEEGVISPESHSLFVANGPVEGLKIYKNYRVVVFLYDDEARTHVVDELTQEIKSYVDTRKGRLILDKGLLTADGQRLADVIAQDPAFAK